MRRTMQRRPLPYKSPRLLTMVALLACLLLMMGSLRGLRPGQAVLRIISNLDDSIKKASDSPEEQAESQAAQSSEASQVAPPIQESQPTESQPPESQAGKPGNAPVQAETSDLGASSNEIREDSELNILAPSKDETGNAPVGDSNLPVAPILNLREDLVLQDWLGLAQDGSLKMQKLEMPAYWRIMKVVKQVPFSDLQKAAETKLRFNDLYSSPANQRSKLITLTVNIRKITRYDTEDNPAGVQELFEVWGWSETSKAWLYVFVTPELPPGLDANTPVNQTAKFAGYFFKLQGYQPGVAKPNAKPLLAPLLIGKFEIPKAARRAAAPQAAAANKIEWFFGAIVLGIGFVVILLRIFVFKLKKPKISRPMPNVNFDIFPQSPFDSSDRNSHSS